MKQKLLKGFWLRVGMIVMTTAFTGTVWAQTTYALQQVTSVEAGGMYVFEQGGHVMNNNCTNSALQTTDTYETTGLTGTETYVWTLETATGGYYMKNVNGTGASPYLNNTSSTNVSFGNNANSVWAFNFQDDNTVLIQNTKNSNRFLGYSTSTSYAYKAYATSNLSSYPHAIKVYQLVEEGGSSSSAVATSVVIDDSNITNTNVYEGTAAGTLAASVVAGEVTLSDATITWSGNNDRVATIDASTGAVTLVAAGTVTFTASYAGVEDVYKPSSKTYTMTVTYSDPNAPGTANNPYTVAQARAAIDADTGVTGVYVTGIVSDIPTAWSEQYSNISFNFVDAEGDNDYLQAFRCVSTEAADASTVQVGDIVVVYGNLTYYAAQQLYEFEKACQLVSLTHTAPVAPVISAEGVTLAYDATMGEIAYSIKNPVAGTSLTATTEADWISDITVEDQVVTFTVTANEGNADRTATIVLTYGEVTKEVTVTQEHYVAPVSEFATLPFEFNGGVADIAETSGLTQEGIDTKDYAAAPYLKFNTTGDYLLLAFNESPGVLTFDIKGNTFSGGTFTVQASEDGEEYSDVATYTTELASGDVLSKTINNLGEDVRYIKWIYTEKSSGNVALGNIKLAAYTGPVPTITVTPTTVAFEATGEQGFLRETLDIEYNAIVVENYESFTVQFYDATGEEEQDASDWLNVGVTGDNDEGYNVQCVAGNNTGEARTAYFKVYALDNDDNRVYSELITVNQAGIVVDYAAVPFTYNGGKENLPTGFTQNGLGTNYSESSAPNTRLKFDNTDDYLVVKIDKEAAMVFFDIKGNGFSGGTFTVQTSADGQEYADIATYTDLGDAQTEALPLDTDVRYIKWVYTEKSSGNVGLGNIKIVDWVDEVTIGEAGYATYVTKHNESFPAGVEAYIGAVNKEESKLDLTPVKTAPKGTPVVLKGEGTFILIPATADALDDVTGNELKASDGTVLGDGTIYVLAKPEDKKVGFYLLEEGTAVAEGKAYIQVEDADVKAFYFDGDEATGINEELRMKNEESPIYNLAGQRVSKMQKGINIVGGKKVLR